MLSLRKTSRGNKEGTIDSFKSDISMILWCDTLQDNFIWCTRQIFKNSVSFKRQTEIMLFFCLVFKFIQCITTYFLSAYNDNPKHANAVHSISIYTPTTSKHPLASRLSTNVGLCTLLKKKAGFWAFRSCFMFRLRDYV